MEDKTVLNSGEYPSFGSLLVEDLKRDLVAERETVKSLRVRINLLQQVIAEMGRDKALLVARNRSLEASLQLAQANVEID